MTFGELRFTTAGIGNRVNAQNFETTSRPTAGDAGGRRQPSGFVLRAGESAIVAGFVVYAMAAPHSIAGAWIGLSFALLGWLLRTLATGQMGLRRSPFDLPLWLFFGWTVLSALLSTEPRTSLAKLISASTFLVFYLTQATLTRRLSIALAALLITSGVAGTLWSVGELVRGRGVRVEEISARSPFRTQTPPGFSVQKGDAIWRIGDERVSSVAEIDDAIRRTKTGQRLSLSVITRGEHVEWNGAVVTDELKAAENPSGLTGGGRTHSFRASGWSRHYETFAEMLQIVAQLALGFALANFQRGRKSWRYFALPAAAFGCLAAGIVLTAMRTVLVAFAIGAIVVLWRGATRGRARLAVTAVVFFALAFGAVAVWRTRATGALSLQDESSRLRAEVARVAAGRVALHPIFGHGMDAVQHHWQEWGFPGNVQIHTHSTLLQIAFERGIPALLFWLWLILVFWLTIARAEKMWRESDGAWTHGLLLGTAGALAGFFASSLVNYNFGDSEVALLIWWLMGVVVINSSRR